MLKHTLAPIAAMSLLLAASSLAGHVYAKEQPPMPAPMKTASTVFNDPELSALAEAIARGEIAQIRALAANSDLSVRGDQNVTLLEWAIWNQQPGALSALLEAGADPTQPGMDDETVVHMAAMADDARYLKILLEHSAPADIVSPRGRWTPLFRAVESKRDEQLQLLVDAGANLNHVDAMGNSLLHQAAKSGASGTMVLKLLELGVEPSLENAQQSTFQPYFFSTPEKVLNAQSRRARGQVRAWLTSHRIPIEASR